MFLEGADGRAEHGSDKEGGSEHSTGGAAGKGERGGDDLEDCQKDEDLEGELGVHRLVDGLVARTHYLRKTEVADAADEEACESGLEQRPRGLGAEAWAEIAEGFSEGE